MYQSNLKITGLVVLLYIIHSVTSVYQSHVSSTLNVKVPDDSCEELLESFATKSANYSFCVILYSRPIKLCENCIKPYQMVVSVHNDILTLEDEEGEPCKAKLLNLDRLQVIEGGFDYVTGLWGRAGCNSCFIEDDQKNPTDQLNDRTKEILGLSNRTQTCIKQHHNDSRSSFGEPLVCSECKEEYFNLNRRYDSLKEDGFCMDIVDLINTTRSQWSEELGCCFDRKKPEWLFTVLSVVITSLPFVFYLAAYLFVSRKEHTVFRQRRLQETFSSAATINAMLNAD